MENFCDPSAGWACIGNPVADKDEIAVEFATDTITVLSNDN